MRHHLGVFVRGRLLPATRRAACGHSVYPDVLPAGLIYRGRLHRRLNLYAPPHRSRVALCVIVISQEGRMPKTPRLTIGLPVYNGENYVAESLEALLGQTFTDYELL